MDPPRGHPSGESRHSDDRRCSQPLHNPLYPGQAVHRPNRDSSSSHDSISIRYSIREEFCHLAPFIWSASVQNSILTSEYPSESAGSLNRHSTDSQNSAMNYAFSGFSEEFNVAETNSSSRPPSWEYTPSEYYSLTKANNSESNIHPENANPDATSTYIPGRIRSIAGSEPSNKGFGAHAPNATPQMPHHTAYGRVKSGNVVGEEAHEPSVESQSANWTYATLSDMSSISHKSENLQDGKHVSGDCQN
ncbi:hypothetical protein FPQ18DRAFT_305604 [Pyronema domesticum]|nr:hypothetical protein FPQ18DRAFT_305604 [Pyronema domesticum]